MKAMNNALTPAAEKYERQKELARLRLRRDSMKKIVKR